MDTSHFDRLARRIPGTSRRGVLAALPVLAFELWRGGSGLSDAEARSCRPKGNKKIKKIAYIMCHEGETVAVGVVQRCRLLKQGATPGSCLADMPPG